MAFFLQVVGAIALVVIAVAVTFIGYVFWLVQKAERRQARRLPD